MSPTIWLFCMGFYFILFSPRPRSCSHSRSHPCNTLICTECDDESYPGCSCEGTKASTLVKGISILQSEKLEFHSWYYQLLSSKADAKGIVLFFMESDEQASQPASQPASWEFSLLLHQEAKMGLLIMDMYCTVSSCNHHALKAAPPPRPTWIASRLCIYNAHIHSKRIFRITCWEARKSKSSAWTQSIA